MAMGPPSGRTIAYERCTPGRMGASWGLHRRAPWGGSLSTVFLLVSLFCTFTLSHGIVTPSPPSRLLAHGQTIATPVLFEKPLRADHAGHTSICRLTCVLAGKFSSLTYGAQVHHFSSSPPWVSGPRASTPTKHPQPTSRPCGAHTEHCSWSWEICILPPLSVNWRVLAGTFSSLTYELLLLYL